MKIENVYAVLDELEILHPRKAKRLHTLIENYELEEDEDKKKKRWNRIRNYIYGIFRSCLTRECRKELENTSILISEESYTLEEQVKNGWLIFTDGARRLSSEPNETYSNFIPREYKKGFYLQKHDYSNENEKQKFLDELKFLTNNKIMLGYLSDLMDRKQEIITYDFEVNNEAIPRKFVELLITTLGYVRIPNKENEENNNKAK